MPEEKKKFHKGGRDSRRSAGKAFSRDSRPGGKSFPAGAKSRPPWLDREKAGDSKPESRNEARPRRARPEGRPAGQERRPERPFQRKPFGASRSEQLPTRERSGARPQRERPERAASKPVGRPFQRKPFDSQRSETRPPRERSEGRPQRERPERPSAGRGDRPFDRKPVGAQRPPFKRREASAPPAFDRPKPEHRTSAEPAERPAAPQIRRVSDEGDSRIKITFEHTHTERVRAVWIYDNMVSEIAGPVANGHAVSVFDQRNRFMGSAIYNENSRIRARMFSLDKQEFSQPYIFGALEAAISRRRVLFPPEDSLRLVFSESDFLPGLIVDKIGDVLAVQLLTMAVDRHAEAIVSHLQEQLHPSGIIAHRDMQIREKEGLPLVPPLVRGIVPPMARVEQDGFAAYANIRTGQKTGLFLDQRFNRRRIIPWSQDARVLDLFCYNAAWSLTAAKAGASEVTAVDSSEPALELARRGAVTNGFSQINFVQSDVFDFLDAHDEKKQYDVIVCDPPAFAKTAKQTDQAAKGYLSLNYRCMKLLRPGGILVTCSCSHYVGTDEFETTLETAARNARMQFQILERCPQPPDHPVLLGFPESDYLKCFVLLRTE